MRILCQLLEWLNHYWPQLVGSGLIALILNLWALYLQHQEHLRKQREQDSKCRSLITEAQRYAWKAQNIASTAEVEPWKEHRLDTPEELWWEAIKKFEEALPFCRSKMEKADILVEMSKIYEKLYMLNEAERCLEEAVKSNCRHKKAWLYLAEIQKALSEFREAIKSLQRHCQLNPEDETAHWIYEQWVAEIRGEKPNKLSESVEMEVRL